MNDPKYLKAVQAAVQACGDKFVLAGSMLLVERIDTEIKTKSGLVIAAGSDKQINSLSGNMPVYVHVLAVGAGYINDDGTEESLDTRPGDILLVGQHSVKWLPVFPIDGYESFVVGVTSEAETQMRFRGIEEYRRFAAALNQV
jgi:co-chaperonin GroES (HSP10)